MTTPAPLPKTIEELMALPDGKKTPSRIHTVFLRDTQNALKVLEPLMHISGYTDAYRKYASITEDNATIAIPVILSAMGSEKPGQAGIAHKLLDDIAAQYPHAVLIYNNQHHVIPPTTLRTAMNAQADTRMVARVREPVRLSLDEIDSIYIGETRLPAAPVAEAPIVKGVVPVPEVKKVLPLGVRHYQLVVGTKDVTEKYLPIALKDRGLAYAAVHLMTTWHENDKRDPNNTVLPAGVRRSATGTVDSTQTHYRAAIKKIEKEHPGVVAQYLVKRADAIATGREALDPAIAETLRGIAVKMGSDRNRGGRKPAGGDPQQQVADDHADIINKSGAKPGSFEERFGTKKDTDTGRGGR